MRNTTRRIPSRVVLSLLACVWAGGAAVAAETVYYLRADVTTVTMPDGKVITMWGFAQDSAFEAEDGVVTVPGPTLAVPPGDTLKIVLENNLTPARTGLPMGCPVCIVIPGQPVTMTPVRFGPAPYPEYEGRIRSMTHETPPGNPDPVEYVWPNMRYGTFLYHSGTHVQCHVQMGLYGAVKQDAGPGEAYPGVSYDQDLLLLYSEIDPAFHEAVATGNYGPGHMMTSTLDYSPKYFLINGKAFTDPNGAFPTVDANTNVLLRFLNAGLQTRVPTLNDFYLTVHAEDGNPYPYPREQYTVLLPAGKTTDAMLVLAGGRTAIYDSVMGLTNAAASPGGMLTYINSVGSLAITTHPVSQTVTEGSPVSFTVAAAGTPPLSYQWQKDAVDIPGATNAAYSIASAALSDAGSYRVIVSNATDSVTSNPATLTVNSLPPPAAPTNLVAQPQVTVPLSIRLTWTDNSTDETGFVLQGALSPMGPIARTVTVGPNTTTFVHYGVTPGVTYYYRVAAIRNGVMSAFTNMASATP